MIDPQHPMKQLKISAGWVVDAITTEYRLTNGSMKTIQRGSPVNPGSSNWNTVNLNGELLDPLR